MEKVQHDGDDGTRLNFTRRSQTEGAGGHRLESDRRRGPRPGPADDIGGQSGTAWRWASCGPRSTRPSPPNPEEGGTMDREADFLDLFVERRAHAPQVDLLVRAKVDRVLGLRRRTSTMAAPRAGALRISSNRRRETVCPSAVFFWNAEQMRAASSARHAPAICCACSSVPPFAKYAVIPVARNVWQQVVDGSSADAARRLIIARTTRRSSTRPVSRRPRLGLPAPVTGRARFRTASSVLRPETCGRGGRRCGNAGPRPARQPARRGGKEEADASDARRASARWALAGHELCRSTQKYPADRTVGLGQRDRHTRFGFGALGTP